MADGPSKAGARPLVHVPAAAVSPDTAQTAGMRRTEAISSRTAGSSALWMGQTVVDGNTASAPHHHGASETAIYVVSGRPQFRFTESGEERLVRTEPGDYVFVPPFVPHTEENPHDEPAVVVIARSTQEAIVENLDVL